MDDSVSKMGVGGLLKKLLPFVLPYRWLLILTLILTFVGSLMAQVNAVVLDRAVDAINALLHMEGGFEWGEAARLLLIVSAVLLGKEVLAAVITFGQRIFGEKIRINVSRDPRCGWWTASCRSAWRSSATRSTSRSSCRPASTAAL